MWSKFGPIVKNKKVVAFCLENIFVIFTNFWHINSNWDFFQKHYLSTWQIAQAQIFSIKFCNLIFKLLQTYQNKLWMDFQN